MLGFGECYIVNILGVTYPCFMSFLALDSEGLDDDKQWLTYWVCFGFFNIIDQFAGIILRFIPFYYFLKLGFLIYLFHPSTLGATYVYNSIISPRIKVYEKSIEELENKLKNQLNSVKNFSSSVGAKKDWYQLLWIIVWLINRVTSIFNLLILRVNYFHQFINFFSIFLHKPNKYYFLKWILFFCIIYVFNLFLLSYVIHIFSNFIKGNFI